MLGPSCLSHIDQVKTFFFTNSADYYETMALYARIIIMFLIGLETDIPYLRRNLRVAGIIACGSSFICTIFAMAVTSFIYEETGAHGSGVIVALTLAVILSNTASPFVTRLAHDLKFANTDIGRLAISSSLIADTYAVFLLIVISRNKQGHDFSNWISFGILYFLIIIAVIVINRYVANWLNRRQRNQKYLKNTEIFVLLAILFVAATSLETMGFSSIIACFIVGAMFPRGGKAGRTLLIKLSYSVHNFVLPIYFGYSGFKADVTHINSLRNFAIVAIIILLSIGGKVTGTLAACFHLKIPLNEGVLLAFLMNLKGHVDLLALTIGVEDKVSAFICYLPQLPCHIYLYSFVRYVHKRVYRIVENFLNNQHTDVHTKDEFLIEYQTSCSLPI